MQTVLKVFTIIVVSLVSLLILGVLIINISPRPAITFTRSTLFKIPQDTRPSETSFYDGQVTFEKDSNFPSAYHNNTFDIYRPAKPLSNTPTIVWVHGGGFIGGDKLELNDYGIVLAKEGYTVLVMNYALAPEAKYPTPILQVEEFIKYLQTNQADMKVNMKNVFIAGDSAGAQIASQFLLTQTIPSYGESMGIGVLLKKEDLKGALLYCGPFDISQLANGSSSGLINFIFKNIGWGYFGKHKWTTSEQASQANIIANVTADFPPAYITDGNTASFETQAKALISKLQLLNVEVESRFYDISLYSTAHEYQFLLDTEPGKTTLSDTLTFLAKQQQ